MLRSFQCLFTNLFLYLAVFKSAYRFVHAFVYLTERADRYMDVISKVLVHMNAVDIHIRLKI